MLHGIVVDIIDVPLKVAVVADRVFPIAALPNSFFALFQFARRTRSRCRDAAREVGFEEAPARRKISIALWEVPKSVEMVRQDADGDGFKWKALLHCLVRAPEPFDLANKQIA